MKRFKKITLYIVGFFLFYLFIGYLFHWVIFPEPEVNISAFFQPGDTLYSHAEKIRLTVIKQEAGKVYCYLEAEAHAPGPPMHIHSGFDEVFKVDHGELSVMVNGKKRTLNAGEKYIIEKGPLVACLKIVPLEKLIKTNLPLISEIAFSLARLKISEADSWRITVKKRQTNLKTSEIIESIANMINWGEVNLKFPKYEIRIEIVRNLTGITVMTPDFEISMSKY